MRAPFSCGTDFGYLVDDSETETSVTEVSNGFSSSEDDDLSLLGECRWPAWGWNPGVR